MSVLISTTVGDIVVDLRLTTAPSFSRNFLKLCKARYYDGHLFFNVIPNRFAQTGDPTGTGSGGCSVPALLSALLSTDPAPRFIADEPSTYDMQAKGLLLASKVGGLAHSNGSQFMVTTGSGPGNAVHDYNTSFKTATHFATVVEDEDGVLEKINSLFLDGGGRPLTDVRVERTHVLHDPFPDPPNFDELLGKLEAAFKEAGKKVDEDWDLESSPLQRKPREEKLEVRVSAAEKIEVEGEGEETEEQRVEREAEDKRKEAKSRAVVLEMLGDIHSADGKPPENVLFVCKLNPVTSDEDLELIFSRFDQGCKCEIQVRRWGRKQSLRLPNLRRATH